MVLLAAAAFWWRGKRWFASGIAAGVVAWSIFLMLFIIWFVRSMENFD